MTNEEDLIESIEMVEAWLKDAPPYLHGSLEEVLDAAWKYSELLD